MVISVKTEQVWSQRRQLASKTAESQSTLFAQYQEHRSAELRNQLVQLNDGLALKAAHRWKQLCDVPFEDLSQIARIGLIEAIEAFDPSLGNAFSSFAMPRITGAIQHFLRDHDWDMVGVSRHSIESASKVKRIKRRWAAMGRLDIDESKIAASVGISERKWQQIAEETARKPVLELDEVHWVAEPDQVDDEQLQAELRREVAKLPAPYRRCIVEHFFANLSEEAIAQHQGVEVAQVQLWLAEGLKKLRSGHLGDSKRLG